MKFLTLIFITLVSYGDSAKILGVFPIPSKSHHILGSALLKELARRGHEVTMISPFPLEDPPERYEDVHLRGLLDKKEENMKSVLMTNQSRYDTMVAMFNNLQMFVHDALENDDLHDFLKQERKYDLVIQLMVFMNEAFLGIGYSVNATTIGFNVIGNTPMTNYFTGNPTHYSYVPGMISGFTDDMTFLQRISNTIISVFLDLLNYFIILPYQEKLVKDYFPKAPPLKELIDGVDLILINSNIATESPRPYLPNLIQIGGFHLEEKQTIPVEVEEFLDDSKHGVIFFSLGSNLNSALLPKETQIEIVEAFRNIKYDVLWTFDGNLENKPKNVMTIKWAPQRAILRHVKVKAFINHGGLASTVEAVYFGKPMICIPFFGDQHKNSADSVAKGYAIVLDNDGITRELLIRSIEEILENPVYRDNIELRSDIYRNQEINAMDKAVFWVDHVLKHKGAKHLKAKAAYLSWYQYFLLDVFSFICFILILALAVSYYSVKFICGLCFCKKKKLKIN